jgi:prepilin-type N-terminal cleavage/methylation domain-containing protein/prepilin-type processing-associated H-X9-DG protein
MKHHPSRASRSAFTLLEMLLVVVIIAILAVLFLPVLSKAKGRAKQIECLSQLKQVGLAAQQFTHEHGGRFPFQVPVKEGGTLELVQAAGGLGDVQYAFRHFQTLSNDLEIPKLLGCPADRRITTNAVTFSSLRNEHISYFIAVTAEYSRPDSLLAGDRNIIARGGNSGSILRIAADTEVAWTSEGHEYKGNLLFAGGHVERTGNAGLKVAMQNPTGPVSAWIPTASSSGGGIPVAGTASSRASDSSGSGGGGASGGGGKSGGRGGASSGFAALQNFFESPQGSGNSTPVPPPVTPANPVYVAPESATVEQPLAALPLPAPAPASKPRTNQIAAAASPTLAIPPVEAEPAWMPEPVPGPLALFVEPERCWWCWVLFLIACLAAAITLSVLIVRRRQRRLHEASVTNLLRPRA